MTGVSRLLGIGMIVLVGSLPACEGPTGPEGPQGPQGPRGEQGPEGTANVQYSPWIEFSDADWSETYSNFGQTRRAYPVGEPAITQDVIDRGVVRVFVDFVATDEDPGTFGSGNYFRYVIIPGGVSLSDASSLDLNDYTSVTSHFGIDP